MSRNRPRSATCTRPGRKPGSTASTATAWRRRPVRRAERARQYLRRGRDRQVRHRPVRAHRQRRILARVLPAIDPTGIAARVALRLRPPGDNVAAGDIQPIRGEAMRRGSLALWAVSLVLAAGAAAVAQTRVKTQVVRPQSPPAVTQQELDPPAITGTVPAAKTPPAPPTAAASIPRGDHRSVAASRAGRAHARAHPGGGAHRRARRGSSP